MENLGINPIQFGAQLLNIGILLFVLKKFAYKPIIRILEERKNAINDSLKLSDETKAKAEKDTLAHDKLLKEAKIEIQQMRSSAAKEAKNLANQIIKDAKLHAEHIVKEAEKDMDKKKKLFAAKMQKEVNKKAANLANQALLTYLDQKTRIKLTEKQIEKL